MMRRIIRWLARIELSEQYDRGWADGVNQQAYEPETAMHGLVTKEDYWGDHQ